MKPLIFFISLITAILSQSCSTSIKQVKEAPQIYQSSDEFYVYITPHSNLTLKVIAAWTLGNAKEYLTLRKVNFFLSRYFNRPLPRNVPVLIPRKSLIQAPPIPSDFIKAFIDKKPVSRPKQRRPSPQRSTRRTTPTRSSGSRTNSKPNSSIGTNLHKGQTVNPPRKNEGKTQNRIANDAPPPTTSINKMESPTLSNRELREVIPALQQVIGQEVGNPQTKSKEAHQGKESNQKEEKNEDRRELKVATPTATEGKADSREVTKKNESAKAKVEKTKNGNNLEKQLFNDLFN